MTKSNVVQLRNPKTDRYIRINRKAGTITGHKVSPGPYKNIPIAKKKQRQGD